MISVGGTHFFYGVMPLIFSSHRWESQIKYMQNIEF